MASQDTQQGAQSGFTAGAASGNPYAALGGAVVGAGLGHQQGLAKEQAERAARRAHERQIAHANKYAVFFNEGQRVAPQEVRSGAAGQGFNTGLMAGMDWGSDASDAVADKDQTGLVGKKRVTYKDKEGTPLPAAPTALTSTTPGIGAPPSQNSVNQYDARPGTGQAGLDRRFQNKPQGIGR